ncbi:hypothetical protein F4805DRAFT_463930 [Annulohypoxylon moriforme]|nr:hypothetical protein F4805DRAFT_463930 [Annulohypoxylon moriforme]
MSHTDHDSFMQVVTASSQQDLIHAPNSPNPNSSNSNGISNSEEMKSEDQPQTQGTGHKASHSSPRYSGASNYVHPGAVGINDQDVHIGEIRTWSGTTVVSAQFNHGISTIQLISMLVITIIGALVLSWFQEKK